MADIKQSTDKLLKLFDICDSVRSSITNINSNIDTSKPKYFVTFPYPYMNGRLHLGHVYTMTKCDFDARFKKSQGFNVLFPFSFHATGAPIFSSANKIKYELETYSDLEYSMYPEKSQVDNLLKMDVPHSEIPNFINPEYWVTYFSSKAKDDISDIGLICDMRRSFFTTTMNPYYDSFVTWQFTNLLKDGFLQKGKRYVIYSIKDQQPCADHDRSVGESIKPIKYYVTEIQGKSNIYMAIGKFEKNVVLVNKSEKFVSFIFNGKSYVSSKNFYNNFSNQENHVSSPESIDYAIIENELIESGFKIISTDKFFHGSGIYSTDKQQDEKAFSSIIYYEPESKVISRSGDICIVSLSDQWFIDYGNEEVKAVIKKYVETEFDIDDGIRKKFSETVDWLDQWPCSRSFGLGSVIPGTSDLIDSLSDSTIYMAFYTVSHLVTSIPIQYVTNEMWNYIFKNVKYDLPADFEHIINQMKNEFSYWYPLDSRVSGKDLVGNHLTMCLFNHYMIWKDPSILPKSFRVNGYLMLNKEKMSKSTGNFMTLSDAVKKYTPDVVRFTLALSDGFDDGNFEEKIANGVLLKFFNEFEWIQDFLATNKNNNTNFDFFDHLFNDEITTALINAKSAYESGHYKFVTDNVYNIINAKATYIKLKGITGKPKNDSLFKKYIMSFVTILQPIAPFMCKYISDNYPDYKEQWIEDTKFISKSKFYYYQAMKLIDAINSDIGKSKKKGIAINKFTINYSTKYNEIQEKIIEYTKMFDFKTFTKDSWNKYISNFVVEGIKISDIRSFSTYIRDKLIDYGKLYFDWISNPDYFATITYMVQINISTVSIEFVEVEPSFENSFGNFNYFTV